MNSSHVSNFYPTTYQYNQVDNIALISRYFEHCDLLSGKQPFPQRTGLLHDSTYRCCFPVSSPADFLLLTVLHSTFTTSFFYFFGL